MNKLYADIGNTHSRFYDEGLELCFECPTAKLDNALTDFESSKDSVLHVASVVREALPILEKHFAELRLLSHEMITDIDFSAVDVSTVGADRLANLAGLLALDISLPALVFDCGTCITSELLLPAENSSSKPRFIGGSIFPGRELQRKSLHNFTSQLPFVENFSHSADQLDCAGKSTQEAILSGIDLGLCGALRELYLRCKKDYADEKKLSLIITGGDSKFFCEALKDLASQHLEQVTLLGLKYIFDGKRLISP